MKWTYDSNLTIARNVGDGDSSVLPLDLCFALGAAPDPYP